METRDASPRPDSPAKARTKGLTRRLEGRTWFVLAKETMVEFFDDRVPMLGAAVAYYTLFSLAPLLVIALAIAGFFFGQEASSGQLAATLGGLLGAQGAQAVQDMVANARRPGAGVLATVLGIVALLFGAGGVFGQLQVAMDTIWDVKRRKGRGVKGFVKDRFFSFAMVIGVGFLLLVSLIVTTILSVMGKFLSGTLPGGETLWLVLNFLISLAIMTGLFGLLFKIVPDVKVAWRDVLIGGFLTAILFTLGKFLIGLYLGRGSVGSVYGAAGSLVIVLVWIYYSAQIFFLGAEFTQVYANRYGAGSRPDQDAIALDPADPDTPPSPGAKGRKGRTGT
jgi:membrane protein